MTDACARRDMRKMEESNVHGCDFFAVREDHNDDGSHQGYVDAVFSIARKMTGAAGVGNGEGRERRGDDVVVVNIIN